MVHDGQILFSLLKKKYPVDIVVDLIQLSSEALLYDVRELAGQVFGRFEPTFTASSVELSSMINGASVWITRAVNEGKLHVAVPNRYFSGLIPVGSGLKKTFVGHLDSVESIAISSDDQFIVSGSGDKTARIWRASTGEVRHILKGHEWAIMAVAFSHSGRFVLTASWDYTARIWDVETGDCKTTFKGHTYSLSSGCFLANDELASTQRMDQNRVVRLKRTLKILNKSLEIQSSLALQRMAIVRN